MAGKMKLLTSIEISYSRLVSEAVWFLLNEMM